MEPMARFDDLTSGAESSFEFHSLVDEVAAESAGEVDGALGRLDALAEAGLWLAGYLAYDAAPGMDPGLVVPVGSPPIAPVVWFGAFEHRRDVEPLPRAPVFDRASVGAWEPDVSRREYKAAIDEIRDLIGSGETYQVNYTFRLRAPFDGDPFGLYASLARAQSGGYCAYLDTGSHRIASASPERFFSVEGSRIRVKPMKGTIRRGRWAEEDRLRAAALRNSEKDRAENLMIVDLLRNDLGRVAEFGSVTVDRLMDLERYDTVWQLTSEISAELRAGMDYRDIFRALFPSGSVTGAPKQRTMEIISRLEQSARGVYCGAVGYIAPGQGGNRRAVFNVAIRTATMRSAGAMVEYGVGGGITWDSTSDGEYTEALAKADILQLRSRPAGLFETMRWDPTTGYFLRERHLERLASSGEYFGYPWNPASIDQALDGAVAGAVGPLAVRLVLDASGAVSVEIRQAPARVGTPEEPAEKVRVAVATEPVASGDPTLFHKTTDRAGYERRLRSRPEADDVLLVNERGEITESTIANVAVRIGERWVTPALDAGCLPGTYRAELIATGVLEEGTVFVEDVAQLPLALVNSVRGWQLAELLE